MRIVNYSPLAGEVLFGLFIIAVGLLLAYAIFEGLAAMKGDDDEQ